MNHELVLVGGGGHCKACIDVIEEENRFRISGIVDIPEKKGEKVLGYEIIACDDDLQEVVKEFKNILITIGQIKSPIRRIEIFKRIQVYGAESPVIISPEAYVSRHARIGAGTIIMHGAIINACASIGQNCIINSKALIEHDAIIEDHCHISTASVVNGGTIIREKTFFGSNSMATEYIEIKSESIIRGGVALSKSP